jgi:hypothetical protein
MVLSEFSQNPADRIRIVPGPKEAPLVPSSGLFERLIMSEVEAGLGVIGPAEIVQ